jgi:glycosyltransferase involved in cell wall biosynthesis
MDAPRQPASPVPVLVVRTGLLAIPPEPGTTRPYNLLRRLSADRTLHLRASLGDERTKWDEHFARPELEGVFTTRAWAPRRDRFSTWRQALNFALGRSASDLRLKDPEGLAACHALVHEAVRQYGPVVILAQGISTLQYVPSCYWGSCVVDSVDAVAMLTARRLAADTRMSRAERWKLKLSLPLIRRDEAQLFRSARVVTYNSTSDIAHLRKRYPNAPIAWVPDGCDTTYFSPEQYPEIAEGDTDLVFVGHMGYPPNADAAIHLAAKIMPHVWAKRPEARAVLIGPQPPEELRRLHDGKRVVVTGEVPDVRPYLKQCAIVASPVRYGAGMKNKLQTGLALGKAMVVSSITAEGFDELEPGRDMLIADEPEAFADACCRLLADPAARRAMGESGMAKIRRYYSWEAATDRLREALAQCEPVG